MLRRGITRLALVAMLVTGLAPAASAGTPSRSSRHPHKGRHERPSRPRRRIETPVAGGQTRLISETYVRLYDPLPKSDGAPAACNWIGYLRWRDRRGPRMAPRADAIIVVMPGLGGGASLFEPFARNVIRTAAARHQHFEVWALDRRSNCLEDHTGMRAALRSHDYHTALGYYFGGRAIAGHHFGGFLTSAQTPFLYWFGLAQTVRDEYDIITHEVPSLKTRARKVFCGGHSLGGSITGAFASWQFDDGDETSGTPDLDDAGYAQCAGFFALDTAVTNNLGGGAKDVGLKGDALYAAETAGIRSGTVPRMATSLPFFNPEVLDVAGILALAARQDPGGSALLRELPHDSEIDTVVRTLLSQNAVAFSTGTPDPRSYRLTNQALLATFFDDNSEPIAALQASLGTYDGGPVTEKDFPLVGSLPDIPLLGPTLSAALADTILTPGGSNSRLMIPARAGGPIYRWRNYNQVGAPDAPKQLDSLGHPFTSPASEVTDIGQFAGALYNGTTDAWEMYFPMRLLADDGAFLTGGRSGDLSAVKYENGPDLRPYLELIAGEGVATESESAPIEPGAQPRRRVILPGYNHLDMATAAYQQNNHKPEQVSTALVSFVDQVIQRPHH